jgi:hypothetical protein
LEEEETGDGKPVANYCNSRVRAKEGLMRACGDENGREARVYETFWK